MNIVQLQEQLKNFSQDQLVREMQMPSGNAPQFLVLGEIMRRQKLQQDFAANQAKGASQSTVAEDAVAAAGVPQQGLAGMARAMAPQTDMAENTGVVAMASGGYVKKMAKGDKIVRGGMILTEQEDGSYRDEQGRAVRSIGEDLSTVGQDIGSGLRSIFAPIREQGPRFVLGPTSREAAPMVYPAEAPAPFMPGPAAATELNLPVFRRPTGGAGLATTLQTAATPDPEQVLRDRTARTMEELRREREPSAPRPAPSARQRAFEEARAAETTDPLAAMVDPVFTAMGDFGGALAGRTAEEQKAIDAQRAAADIGAPELQNPAFRAAMAERATPETEAAQDREIERAAEQPTPPAADTTPSGGAGGAGGAGGMSSYEQELMDMLGRREKAAEQDKWLALAQVGLNMMSSTQPTLLGAIGEAGVKGVEAARTARDQYDKDRLDLLGAIEQSRQARAAAASRAARGASSGGIGGLKLKDYLGALKTSADVAADHLKMITGDMDPYMLIKQAQAANQLDRASEIQSALDAAIAAQNDYMGAVSYIGGAGPTPVEQDDTMIDLEGEQ